jgi:hypothetical protein
MIQVSRIDKDGFYVEPVLLDDNLELFIVKDDLVGVQCPDGFHRPKWDGTEWVEGLSTDEILVPLKKAVKDSLSAKCNEAICGGFPSSALGVEHTYPSDEEAQRNFHSELDRIRLDSTYTTIYFKTFDAGYLPHTVDQFTKVFLDGHAAGRSQIAKLNQLKADVDKVTDPNDFVAIKW